MNLFSGLTAEHQRTTEQRTGMAIGRETGSLINVLYSRMTKNQPVPEVGMGATLLSWSDRRAATITKVTPLESKTYLMEIEVTEDHSKVVSGSCHDGSAVYAYEPADGPVSVYRFDVKRQTWVSGRVDPTTKRFKAGGGGLVIGLRNTYYDPHF